MVRRIAQLRQKTDAAGADICGWWIKQCAVIGKGNMVQVAVGVVGVERAPAAIAALHADQPLGAALDRFAVADRVEPVERKADRSGVVEIGVVRVLILKRPAAGSQSR